VDIDDLKNPEYRKGRFKPPQKRKPEPEPPHRPRLNEETQRARFAVQTARAEFGRFYWNDKLGRRMERELQKTRQRWREANQRARKRRRNGARF
jgi:hypothetical protein